MDISNIEKMIAEGNSSYDIAKKINKSQSSVRYWLNKYGLKTNKEQIGRKSSKVWKLKDGDFEKTVIESLSISECLVKLGMSIHPNNYISFKKRCTELKIKIPKAKNAEYKRDTILRVNSSSGRSSVKSKILREKLLEYSCQICMIGATWNDKPLGLTLDHINGISNDHRIKNLRFICPNCNRQLTTYCNKNLKER